MAGSIGIVPTLPLALSGESSRLLKDDTEAVSLEQSLDEAPSPGADFTPRLKKRIVWTYGTGETGVWASHVILGFYLNTFLLEVAGLNPANAGNVLLIGEIWDALVNPIIGVASDATVTRWGRRRPWLLFAAVPFALSYFGMWLVWPDAHQGPMFAYYMIVILCFNTASNSIAVPFTALTSDLAATYDHATELTQARMLCNLVVGVAASFIHSILTTMFTYPRSKTAIDYQTGYLLSGLIWALVFLMPPLIIFFGIREKEYVQSSDEGDKAGEEGAKAVFFKIVGLWKNVFGTLTNRAFALLTAFYFLSWTAVQLVQNNLYLYSKYVIRQEASFTWIMLLLQLVAAASLFMWSIVSRFIGKRITFMVGVAIWLCMSIANYWITATTPIWVIYVTSACSAFGVSVTFLIPWSMIPDIIDDDEVLYGSRREGVFYSVFVLFQKIGLAIALSASSYALSAAGYISPAHASPDADPLYQPSAVLQVLKFVFGPIPAIMIGLAIIFAFFYPLSRARVAENIATLQAKRDEQSRSEAKLKKKESSGFSDVSASADEIPTELLEH